jgi:hypothetical protein
MKTDYVDIVSDYVDVVADYVGTAERGSGGRGE